VFSSKPEHFEGIDRSADFQVCCIADFKVAAPTGPRQVVKPSHQPGLRVWKTRETAGLETCATRLAETPTLGLLSASLKAFWWSIIAVPNFCFTAALGDIHLYGILAFIVGHQKQEAARGPGRALFPHHPRKTKKPVKHTRIIVTHYGGPEALQVVEEECPEPKEGEVRVRVLAAGVALPDIMAREGIHPETPPVPFTPG